MADELGRVGVWEDPVPARLPSPSCDLEQLRQEGAARKGGRVSLCVHLQYVCMCVNVRARMCCVCGCVCA